MSCTEQACLNENYEEFLLCRAESIETKIRELANDPYPSPKTKEKRSIPDEALTSDGDESEMEECESGVELLLALSLKDLRSRVFGI